jgi:site-specific DNA-methyltransferase (adenine-specific)
MPKIELIQGDCLEKMKDIPDKSIDMILCDLPYGTTACKWDTIIPFEPLWEQYKRIIKDNGAIVLTASQPFTSALVMSNIKMFKYEWIWYKNKPTGMTGKYAPLRDHESVVVFGNKKIKYYPIKQKTKSKSSLLQAKSKRKNIGGLVNKINNNKFPEKVIWNEYVYPRSVLPIDVEPMRKGRLHPTQKPVALLEYLIRTYTNEGETVLDNCMGSGSTGVACKNLNRNFIGIELDPEYFKIAEKRIMEFKKEEFKDDEIHGK